MADYAIQRLVRLHPEDNDVYETIEEHGDIRHNAVIYAEDMTFQTGIAHRAIYTGKDGKTGKATECCGGTGCKPPQEPAPVA